MLNVTGKGIICKELELRFTTGGTAVCQASLVNNEEYNGNRTPHFTTLKLWGERAEVFANEITKGCLIDITSGILKHPVTESKGKKYYNTEVVVLEWELIQKFDDKQKEDKKPASGKSRFSSKKK